MAATASRLSVGMLSIPFRIEMDAWPALVPFIIPIASPKDLLELHSRHSQRLNTLHVLLLENAPRRIGSIKSGEQFLTGFIPPGISEHLAVLDREVNI